MSAMMSDLALREPLTDHDDNNDDGAKRSFSETFRRLGSKCFCGRKLTLALQVLHFGISMFFLWAGLVEFVNHPPYFDAYGDAKKRTDLLPRLFKNDPRFTETELLRIMDLPILLILVMYQLVCFWLKFKGLSWIMTFSLLLTLVSFWVVNFAGLEQFAWSYYSKRMKGLQLQVSTISLSGTVVFMVIFYSRKKLPFKFKSSLRIQPNSKFHTCWNFFAIYLVMFMSMIVWFIKMYASWALFTSREEILQLCSTTTEVECYPCHNFTASALRHCAHQKRHHIFTCSQNFPDSADQGSFCVFNFNMSVYGFLLTFAYIGGICVFTSTFIRIAGHYTVRGMVFVYETVLRLHYRSSDLISRQRESMRRRRHNNQRPTSRDGNENLGVEPVEEYSSDSGDDGNGLINSLILELP